MVGIKNMVSSTTEPVNGWLNKFAKGTDTDGDQQRQQD
jgi:hypothetical protein